MVSSSLLGPPVAAKVTSSAPSGLEARTWADRCGGRLPRHSHAHVPQPENATGHGVPVLRTVAAHDRRGQLELPLRLRKSPRGAGPPVNEVLDQVGLGDAGTAIRTRCPAVSSSGWRWPAPVYSPTLLLLDEPLSNLDAKLR